MEEKDVNILDEKKEVQEPKSVQEPKATKEPKSKKGLLIVVGILLVLVVALAVCYFVLFKGSNNPKSFYTGMIDRFASRAKESLATAETLVTKPVGINYDVDINLTAQDSAGVSKDIVKLINKIDFKLNAELDYKNKVADINYDIKYDNKELIKALMVLNDKDLYVKSDDLYDKALKQTDDSFSSLWEVYNIDDYKVFIDEMVKIIKNNLKDSYFTKAADGKLNKVILALEGEKLVEFEKNVLTDISNNDKVLTIMANLSSETKENIKSDILDNISNLTADSGKIIVTTWLNGNNIEKLSFLTEEVELLFTKNSDNKYNIVVKSGESEVELGTIEMNDKTTNLEINYMGAKINYSVTINGKSQSGKLNLVYGNYNLNVTFEGDDSKGNCSIGINADGITGNIKLAYTIKKINKVTTSSFTDYVLFNDIDQAKYTEIMQKLAKKEGFVLFYQDMYGASSLT